MDGITEFRAVRFLQECRKSWLILALCCLIGAVSGVLIADAVGKYYFHLMRMAVVSPVSIVGTAVSVWIPFLVCVYLIVHFKHWLVYLICTLYIARFAATGYALVATFHQAAWLVRLAVQFPQICLIPCLLYLSICRLCNRIRIREVISIVVLAIMVGMIDYLLISPLWTNLINDYETMGRYAIHVGLNRCL